MTSFVQETQAFHVTDHAAVNSSGRPLRPNCVSRSPWQEPKSESRRRLFKQFSLVTMGSMGHFCLGTVLTWPSPGLADMALNNRTLVGSQISLTVAEMDMTGSLVSLGSLFGAFAAGWVMNVVGRRRSLLLNALPFLLGWLTSGLAPSAPVFLVARFLLGIGVGSSTVAGTTYIMEISDAKLRGTMSIVPTLSLIIGGQYTLALGNFLQWHYLAFACLAPVLILVVTAIILPESPSYLVVSGRCEAASRVLLQLRGDYADLEEEIGQLKRLNQSPSDRMRSGFPALLERKILLRLMAIIMIFLFQHLSGNLVLIVQTGRVLVSAGSPFDPAKAATIVVGMRLGGALGAFFLLDRIGRKYCLAISHAVNASSLLILGMFVYLNGNGDSISPSSEMSFTSLKWVPMVCISVSLFFGDIGLQPVPFTLAAEYFPTNVRTQAASLCMSLGTIFSFFILQMYSPMQELLTQAGLYWFYAISSGIAVVFVLAAITETKARPIG